MVLLNNNLFKYELAMILWLAILVVYGNHTHLTMPVFLISGFIFYRYWDLKEKWIWLRIWAIFSTILLIGENIVIYQSKALQYRPPNIFGNVPHWLLYAYANMTLIILVIYQYYKGVFE